MPTAIATKQNGHWTAWLVGSPHVAFGGGTPTSALLRLCEATSGVDADSYVVDPSSSADGRLVFVSSGVCPDCGGSGRYVGLNDASYCNLCSGSGRF